MLGWWWSDRARQELFTLLSLLVLLALFRIFRPGWVRRGMALMFVAGIVGLLVAGRGQPLPGIDWLVRPYVPIFTLTDVREPVDRVARFCRVHLPEAALVLTPPREGRFRLVAERAIVVDFKSPTTRDATMVEWRRRIADCYGAAEGGGFRAAEELDGQYRRMTDDRLEKLARRYGVTHAVLYSETPSRLAVLYEDERFKLVQLSALAP